MCVQHICVIGFEAAEFETRDAAGRSEKFGHLLVKFIFFYVAAMAP